MTKPETTLDKRAIEAIEDAIYEGAREWDAWAVPATQEPAKKAWAKIKELLDGR
jgi:hypothetical protein